MDDGTDITKRLQREAAFQDARIVAAHRGEQEARDRFYYLANRAYAHYYSTLEHVAGKRVLVVGCSEGGVTPLARRGAEVTGIDVSPEAISTLNKAIANEGLTLADAQLMNAEHLAFPASSFDVIACTGVLHHLDVASAAASWSNALKPSGIVTMIEPMARHPMVAAYRAVTPSMRTPDEHPLVPADIRMLRRHFGKVTVTGYALTSVLSVALGFVSASLRDKSCRLLESVDDALLRLVPPLAYCCWTSVIVCEEPRKA